MANLLTGRRKSRIDEGEIYFWTATINGWKHLLKDEFKQIILNSWEYLTNKDLVDVFAFVIMPNHLHMIWRMNGQNGKESPHGSFLKFTAHEFLNKLKLESPHRLADFRVNACNKRHEFWRRDSLAIPLFTPKVAWQKLNYIHKNPLGEHWQLVKNPGDYKYCSAKFYETGEKEFAFLKNLRDEF